MMRSHHTISMLFLGKLFNSYMDRLYKLPAWGKKIFLCMLVDFIHHLLNGQVTTLDSLQIKCH